MLLTPLPLSQTVTPSRTPLERDVLYGRPLSVIMHGAGQGSVESNHRRAADECNGIAWAIKKKKRYLLDEVRTH